MENTPYEWVENTEDLIVRKSEWFPEVGAYLATLVSTTGFNMQDVQTRWPGCHAALAQLAANLDGTDAINIQSLKELLLLLRNLIVVAARERQGDHRCARALWRVEAVAVAHNLIAPPQEPTPWAQAQPPADETSPEPPQNCWLCRASKAIKTKLFTVLISLAIRVAR